MAPGPFRSALAVVAVAGCGRIAFAPRAAGNGGDAASDAADAQPAHVTTASGWTARVLVDLTGVVPYNPNDFDDNNQVILDNAPETVAALYPPFDADLAVCAGRSIIAIDAGGGTVVHDYRPATPDTTGPDDCGHLVYGAPPDTGPALWIGAGTQGGGDGVYVVTPGWALNRDSTNNNVNGIGYDAQGAFDGVGAPSIYFVDQSYVYRRTGPAAAAQVLAETQNDAMGQLAVTASGLFVVHGTTAGAELDRIAPSSHAVTALATATSFELADGGALASTSVAAIRDGGALVVVAAGGAAQQVAASADPAWVWRAASAPQPPHALAGSYVVLESNRALDRDELLLVSPGP